MRILSGIQPTGNVHLGNLIGALRHYVTNQDLGEAFYFVADLHGLTLLPNPEEHRKLTRETAAVLLACGVDPDKATVFIQSHVAAEHTQLAWILTCLASVGELNRMTQFKEKGEGKGDKVGAGIFTYPVLMAADVLCYDADRVPVGADQKQHLELARNLAQRCNNRYGEDTLRVPDPLIAEVGARVMDLQDPHRKMSTSTGSEKGTIWLLDEPKRILKKFRSAVTDSETEVRYDPEHKPGVSNLLELFHIVTEREIVELEAEYRDSGYGAFKSAVGEAVVEYLTPIRERYYDLLSDEKYLDDVLRSGAERARQVAAETVSRVNERVGLMPLP